MYAEDLTPPPRTGPCFTPSRFPDCHDPFWPRIELCELRERLQLDGKVSEARLALAVRCAAIEAADEFASWRSALRRHGFRRLEDVSGHANGRALSVCYHSFVEAAVRRNLLGGPTGRGGISHG